MTVFFTSDTHFGHENIVSFCNRPFGNTEEMDRAMMDAWNVTVRSEDTVWHLGDFSLSRDPGKIDQWLHALNGTKHLIRGNHDVVKGVTGWASMQDMANIHCYGHRFVLFHYPMRDWQGKWQEAMHLYGHVHGNMEPLDGSMDVGVDTWGGKPVSVEELMQAIPPFQKPPMQSRPFVRRKWNLM